MRVVTLKHRLIAIPLMGLVLGASAAPVLSRMTCLMSGHRVLAIGSMEDCCPEEEATGHATIEATCCDFAQAVPVKEDYRPEPVAAVASTLDLALSTPIGNMDLDTDRSADGITTRPPPLSAPLRLSRISSYLL